MLPSSSAFRDFWAEHRLCTVTTLRPNGTPHVVPMGVVIDAEADVAWAITSTRSQKVHNIRLAASDGASFAACQVDGRNWSTIEGTVWVLDDPASIHEAERRYAERYRTPRPNPDRVALRVAITHVLGNVR